ncbi:glycosyltransferase family 4 protein [Streptacidiphilus sp. P02-A3a]|uniref:glycosyltransferase family 4 protein n=1 Tax=Streptacidiphilus sp. P02-A3a TaxID=2704468 RepID=UPI0015FD0596|nr:glycosyltransferase family 4 protein [Streptacidiphilus sp. P02-A3a]QMU67198.1 glycosyltransferase family 4 protein [Streptacidiphilus sp. P02-A3a]
MQIQESQVQHSEVDLPSSMAAGPSALRRVVLTWMSTSNGGAERSVGDLAASMARLGLEVVIIWWHYQGSPQPHQEKSVEFFGVDNAPDFRAAVARALRAARGDTVVISNHRTIAIDAALASQFSVPVVSVLRALFIDDQKMRFIAQPDDADVTALYPSELDWGALKVVDSWIGISRASSQSILRHVPPGTTVETIYNGVVSAEPSAAVLSPRAPRRFLTLCRLESWKQVEFVLREFASACAGRDDITLDVVGGGPQLESCQGLVRQAGLEQRIVLHGYQPNPDEWIKRGDVLLHGAPIEGFGRVVPEAGMYGRPAIVAESGATGETVLDGISGLTYRPGQPGHLAAQILAAAAWSPQEWSRFGRNARMLATRVFSLDRVTAEYLIVCGNVLRNFHEAQR